MSYEDTEVRQREVWIMWLWVYSICCYYTDDYKEGCAHQSSAEANLRMAWPQFDVQQNNCPS